MLKCRLNVGSIGLRDCGRSLGDNNTTINYVELNRSYLLPWNDLFQIVKRKRCLRNVRFNAHLVEVFTKSS